MDAANWLWLAVIAGVVAVLYGVLSMISILRLDAGNALERIERLAAVAIAVRSEQHLRRNLAEAVQYPLDAKVGGAR